MCGVYSIVSSSANIEIEKSLSNFMKIKHRGPDSDGYVIFDDNFCLVSEGAAARMLMGHVRLSILDLSDAGSQPMVLDGLTLTFNGEIYNFIELRQELVKLGHVFRTRSDTEVILHAYKEWGRDCFKRFNGMWAIVLFDSGARRLIVSRDRMGVKPLYFSCSGGKYVFSSELRAILADGDYVKAPDPDSIFDFLISGISDHNGRTFYRGIEEVPAGACWAIDVDALELSKGMYHEWTDEGESFEYVPGELRDLLNDSVSIRMRSDAPMVSLLSGGLDSSLITYLCSKNIVSGEYRKNFVGAYTYGYSQQEVSEHDESELARTFMQGLPDLKHIVEKYHHIPGENELVDLFSIQEQPFPTPSVLAGMRIYKAISQAGLKVVLTGEGADELFGGYTRQYLPYLSRDYLLAGKMMSMLSLLRTDQVSLKALLTKLMWSMPKSALQFSLSQFRPAFRVINKSFLKEKTDRFGDYISYCNLPLKNLQRKHILSTNLPMILRFADRNSMAFGIEQRLPFMDYRIVQYALNAPLDSQYKGGLGKMMLRNEFSGFIEDNVLTSPKLRGFGNAEQHYVQSMMTEDALSSPPDFVHQYIDVEQLKRELKNDKSHPLLWLPVSFLMWAKYVY